MESIRSEQQLYQRSAHFATTMVEFLSKMQDFPVVLQREEIQMVVQQAANSTQGSLAVLQHPSASFDVQMVAWQTNLLNNIAQQFHAIALDYQQAQQVQRAVQTRVVAVESKQFHTPIMHRVRVVGHDETQSCGTICQAKKAASSMAGAAATKANEAKKAASSMAEAAATKAKEAAKKLKEAAVAAIKPIIQQELGPLQTMVATMGKEEFRKWSQGLAKDLGVVLPNDLNDTNALLGALVMNIPAVSTRVTSPTFVSDTKAILRKHLLIAATTAKHLAIKHAEQRVQTFVVAHPDKIAAAVDLGKAFGVTISATSKPEDVVKQLKEGLGRFAKEPATDPVQVVTRLVAVQKFMTASN